MLIASVKGVAGGMGVGVGEGGGNRSYKYDDDCCFCYFLLFFSLLLLPLLLKSRSPSPPSSLVALRCGWVPFSAPWRRFAFGPEGQTHEPRGELSSFS